MVAVLSDIRSIFNVGSMFRTADAAGMEKLYLAGITPGPLDRFGAKNEKLAKVALGAEESVQWERTTSTHAILSKLRDTGFLIYAIEQDKRAIRYRDARVADQKKIVLVAGNEVEGLSNTILDMADCILEIPMRGSKESLNVSVAFGIVVYSLLQ